MTKPIIVSQSAIVGSARYGLRNICVLRGVITNPTSYRQMPLALNPIVSQAKQDLRKAGSKLFYDLAQECMRSSDDEYKLPATKACFHYTGKRNETISICYRVSLSDGVAAMTETLAAACAATPAADGRPGRPAKPAGVIDLPWGHAGNRVELIWESRPTTQLRRISGLHDDTDMDALAAVFADAGLDVAVAPAHIEGDLLPMAGTFDLTFAAGSKPPTEVMVEDDEGHQVAIKLTRVPLIKPDPVPPGTWYSPVAAPTAVVPCSYGYTPLAMNYAAAVATPGAAASPATRGVPTSASPGGRASGRAAAPASATKTPKRKHPEAAAKQAATQRPQQPAVAPKAPATGTRERPPDTLDRCSHCFSRGHVRDTCPNINAMDWTPPAAPPASDTDVPHNMETDAAAPDAGEQGPPAAVTASPRPDGPSA